MPMDSDGVRSKIISNQIGRMLRWQTWTGDGFTTDFTLTFEVYAPDLLGLSDSAEIMVFENGLKLEKTGGSLEYAMQTVGGLLKVIHFKVAPLSGHIIAAEYRPLVNKT